MMKALIVYDSLYGNTEKIAREICSALSAQADVRAMRVANITPELLAGLDLLVVGSPTQGFRPTGAIRSWLNGLARTALKGVSVAAFDTRADVADVHSRVAEFLMSRFGYAAEPIAAQLVKKGGAQIIAPEGFFVVDKEGPLKEGELERAVAWAKQLIAVVR